jgi:hypothetical protein
MGHAVTEGLQVSDPYIAQIQQVLAPAEDADYDRTWEELKSRITVLNERAWERRVSWDLVERWLDNFDGSSGQSVDVERIHALYVLAQFLYFGSPEIRVLLKALYRDLFLVPLIQQLRRANGNTRDVAAVKTLVEEALKETRFLGVGNPSESGVHLLYFFRQENRLSKDNFMDTAQILERNPSGPGRRLRHSTIEHYVFVDDVCGSGETAERYSTDFLEEAKTLKPEVKLSYLCMFGTSEGMDRVRANTIFEKNCEAVFELDSTYQSLSTDSRYLKVMPALIDGQVVQSMCAHYGTQLWSDWPRGFMDCELLLGFHHNTPDNTLPIIWMEQAHGCTIPWTPVFRRYPKL